MRGRSRTFRSFTGLLTAFALLFSVPGVESLAHAEGEISAFDAGVERVPDIRAFNVSPLTGAAVQVEETAQAVSGVPVGAGKLLTTSSIGDDAVETKVTPTAKAGLAPARSRSLASLKASASNVAGNSLKLVSRAATVAHGHVRGLIERNRQSVIDWLARRRDSQAPASPLVSENAGAAAETTVRLLPAARTRRVQVSQSVVPDQIPGGEKKGRRWLGLGSVAVLSILALAVAQLPFGAFNAMNQMSHIVTDTAIVSTAANIVGRVFAPIFVDNSGDLRRTLRALLGSSAVRYLGIASAGVLFFTNHADNPAFFAICGMTSFFASVYDTADGSLPAALYGQNAGLIEKFNAWKNVITKTAALITFGVFTGFPPGMKTAFVSTLVGLAASWGLLGSTLKLSARADAERREEVAVAAAPAVRKTVVSALKDLWRQISGGAKVVLGNSVLRLSFFAATIFAVVDPLFLSGMSNQFGDRLMGGPGVFFALMFSFLLGGALGNGRLLVPRKKHAGLDAAAIEEKSRQSMLRWLAWGAIAFVAEAAAMALPLPPMAGHMTLASLLMIPFAWVLSVVSTQINSYFQAKTPQTKQIEAQSFQGGVQQIVILAGLVALRCLFEGSTIPHFSFHGMPGFEPFAWVAGAMVPVGFCCWWIARKLGKVSAPAKES